MRLKLREKKIIMNSNKSYSQISNLLKVKYGIKVSKSLISYYKRSRDRISNIKFENLTNSELEWLFGLFLADGCKFKEKSYSYVIKIALNKNSDAKIFEKLADILKKLNVNFTKSFQGNCLIIKIFSKRLFEKLPQRGAFYKPKNSLAFLGGLIDGDGCKIYNSAILVQSKNRKIMNYLSQKFNLRKNSKMVKTNFGKFRRVEFYIPVVICDILRNKKFSEKLSQA